MNTDLWEILWTGTISGVVSGIIVTGIFSAARKSKARLMEARQCEAVYLPQDESYHWMKECKEFPTQGAEAGTGGKEPCLMCLMITDLAYEKWSMFRRPWYKRLPFKKRYPGEHT